MEKKTKNSGEYTGSIPAFSATHNAAQREVQVCTLIRACINVEVESVPRICLLTDSVDRSCFGY